MQAVSQIVQVGSGLACLFVAWRLRKVWPYQVHFGVLGVSLVVTGIVGGLTLFNDLPLYEANDIRRPFYILERLTIASMAFVVLTRVQSQAYATKILREWGKGNG